MKQLADLIWWRMGILLEEWDAARARNTLLKDIAANPPDPWSADPDPFHDRIVDYLTRKGLVYLINARGGQPYLRAEEHFIDEQPEPVRARTLPMHDSRVAPLYHQPVMSEMATGYQLADSVVAVCEFALSPDDFSLWLVLENYRPELVSADFISSKFLRFTNPAAAIDLPHAEASFD